MSAGPAPPKATLPIFSLILPPLPCEPLQLPSPGLLIASAAKAGVPLAWRYWVPILIRSLSTRPWEKPRFGRTSAPDVRLEAARRGQ